MAPLTKKVLVSVPMHVPAPLGRTTPLPCVPHQLAFVAAAYALERPLAQDHTSSARFDVGAAA